MPNDINNFLSPADVLIDVEARCKRGLLSLMADHAAGRLEIDRSALFDALMEREQLGTTAIGHGIAIPHAKVDIEKLWGVFARTKTPIDFDALDDRPVDLMFLLLAPVQASADHLKALSRIARLVRSEEMQNAMRGASDAKSLYSLAIGELDAAAA